jgi:septal ring factor EnvC (AmiA/AmiB activator)
MTSIPEYSETDLTGFDDLWQTGYEDAQNFIREKKAQNTDKHQEEMNLVQKEIEEKAFDVQKLQWQLNEREKELKILYDELHRIMELNKKLDQQLEDYEKLCQKQQNMMQLMGSDKAKEPILPFSGQQR